jgi:hypothetical protein
MWLIEAVIPHPRNPNRHNDDQIALLAKIIAVQGWRNPITISTRSGFIVGGHARRAAALVLELDRVPVDFQWFPDEASEYAHMIADNRVAELAEMDMPTLKDLLIEIDTGALDTDLTGYTTSDIEKLMSQFAVNTVDAPELSAGDRPELRQMTFTLHVEQVAVVEAAVARAKEQGGGKADLNENTNGNAIAWICDRFMQ